MDIKQEFVEKAHIGLYKGVQKASMQVPVNALGGDGIGLKKTTIKNYRAKGIDRLNYRLNVKKIHFVAKKVKHKSTNAWLRVALQTNRTGNKNDKDIYESYIRGFFTNTLNKNRKTKAGKNRGKVTKYNYLRITINKQKAMIMKSIQDEINKIV